MPTIRDVAKLAGVSPITVSRVINNLTQVSRATRQRVEAAVAALEYVPNTLGTSLRSKQTHILALLLTDITNPFWTTVARGVEDAARRNGYNLILCNTDESDTKQDEHLSALLKKRVDGFLLVPANSNPDPVRRIRKQGVPVVVIDRWIPDVPVDIVRGDLQAAAYALMKHLIASGHQRVAMLAGPAVVSTAVDRVSGYRLAVCETEMQEQVYWGEYNQNSGYEMALRALNTTPRPTALFAANNFITIGAIHAILHMGLHVPEDVALVTFDELPPSPALEAFMTVAAQPAYEMGHRATELLLLRLANPHPEERQQIVLPAQIIVRQSSGASHVERAT